MMDRQALQWPEDVEQLSATQVFAMMDFPLRDGLSEARVFIEKSLSTRLPEIQIFDQLTYDYEDQSIFRKEQSCVAICVLHERAVDAAIKEKCRAFLERVEDGKLPLMNRVECAFLRVIRKLSILSLDRLRRNKIENLLKTAELDRFVGPLSARDLDHDTELELHNLKLTELRSLTREQLEKELVDILKTEKAVDDEFIAASARSSGPPSRRGGFESYGVNGTHEAFRNIIKTFGIEVGGGTATNPE
jgi:hypothetical protein